MTARSIVWVIALWAMTGLAPPGCATKPSAGAGGAGAEESAARISAGLTRLGASPERSACFASKIASILDAPEASEAIDIIDRSTSKEDMRSSVLGASAPVKQSFIRAHFGCSFFG